MSQQRDEQAAQDGHAGYTDDHISPLEFRYFRPGDPHTARVHSYLSEDANISYLARVESALANALWKLGVCPRETAQEIDEAAQSITGDEVRAEEAVTQHN